MDKGLPDLQQTWTKIWLWRFGAVRGVSSQHDFVFPVQGATGMSCLAEGFFSSWEGGSKDISGSRC